MKKENPEDLDQWITEIRAEAEDDDGQLWVFRRVVRENLKLPTDGWVIGEPVQVVEIDYKGIPRQGLTAIVRRADGSRYTVSAADVALSAGFPGARYLDAYRRWLGLDPHPARSGRAGRVTRSDKVEKADIDPDKAVQMVVLSFKKRSARCRLAGSEREITFRLMDCFPGAISINRPFLRALHGYGLCLWRLEHRDEALPVFNRLLWLSPSDNLGARFLIEPIQAGEKWKRKEV